MYSDWIACMHESMRCPRVRCSQGLPSAATVGAGARSLLPVHAKELQHCSGTHTGRPATTFSNSGIWLLANSRLVVSTLQVAATVEIYSSGRR